MKKLICILLLPLVFTGCSRKDEDLIKLYPQDYVCTLLKVEDLTSPDRAAHLQVYREIEKCYFLKKTDFGKETYDKRKKLEDTISSAIDYELSQKLKNADQDRKKDVQIDASGPQPVETVQ